MLCEILEGYQPWVFWGDKSCRNNIAFFFFRYWGIDTLVQLQTELSTEKKLCGCSEVGESGLGRRCFRSVLWSDKYLIAAQSMRRRTSRFLFVTTTASTPLLLSSLFWDRFRERWGVIQISEKMPIVVGIITFWNKIESLKKWFQQRYVVG